MNNTEFNMKVFSHKKQKYTFTVAIFGVILSNIIYIAFNLMLGNDIVLLFHSHLEPFILNTFNIYLNTIVFYFPFNCYILTLGYFVRSDGYPKLPFISLLLANISNILLSVLFMGTFHMGVEGSALGSVIGYAIGAVYITTYFIKENRTFSLQSTLAYRNQSNQL